MVIEEQVRGGKFSVDSNKAQIPLSTSYLDSQFAHIVYLSLEQFAVTILRIFNVYVKVISLIDNIVPFMAIQEFSAHLKSE